jgi:uncharacterized protein YcbK (DUF882 family)
MGDLTKDFSKKEFACKCCGEANINQRLVESLQKLKDLINIPVPIHILSGYRCPKHNAEVGGKKHSQHLLGTAADIKIDGLSVDSLAFFASQIEEFNNGGIGKYHKQGFVHVDIRDSKARWEE